VYIICENVVFDNIGEYFELTCKDVRYRDRLTIIRCIQRLVLYYYREVWSSTFMYQVCLTNQSSTWKDRLSASHYLIQTM